eukprot:m.12245 g.12245  ORF g.12245 m.12245 type:complete len:380 (+) comp17373_c0_seq1:45-1184(+)
MVAAINGSTNCARALVAYGADYSLRDLEGRTALEIARQCSRSATVAFLEEHERLISGMHIKAAEDDVAEEPEQEHLALTEADSEQLIEETAQPDSLAVSLLDLTEQHEIAETSDHQGEPMRHTLCLVVQQSRSPHVSYRFHFQHATPHTIHEQAVPTQADVEELCTAVQADKMAECQRIVQRCGPSIIATCRDHDSVGNAALHYAAADHPEILEWFLQQQINCNALNKGGCPALIWAVNTPSVACTRLLLAYGADTSIMTVYGKTALVYAKEYRRQEITSLLEEHERHLAAQQGIKPALHERSQPASPAHKTECGISAAAEPGLNLLLHNQPDASAQLSQENAEQPPNKHLRDDLVPAQPQQQQTQQPEHGGPVIFGLD